MLDGLDEGSPIPKGSDPAGPPEQASEQALAQTAAQTEDQAKDQAQDTVSSPEDSPAEILGRMAAFADVDRAVLDAIGAACAVERYEGGETLFTMGQTDDALYAVLKGDARMTRAGGDHGDIAVETVTPGTWIGLTSFALEDGAMAMAAVQAIGPLNVLAIDSHTLREMANEEASLAMAMMRLCASAARGGKKTMDPSARVYRYLLSLVRKSAGGAQIPEMPRHAALAEAAGVTDVEAAGAVAELISRGVAKRAYPGLTVLDAGALHRAAFD